MEEAAMRNRLMALGFALSVGALLTIGCAGGSSTSVFGGGAGGSGSLVVLGGDAPLCDVLSFQVTVTGLTLTPVSGGTPISVLSSGQSITVDFASLMDFTTVLNLTSAPPGTYSQITLTLSNPRLTVLDATKSPPAVAAVPATLNSSTIKVDITPNLTLTTTGTAALQVDFDLLKSIATDSKGQATGAVNPVFSASPTTVTSATGSLAEIEDLRGVVKSVNTTGSGSFTGSFVVQTPGANGPTRTVNVNGSTAFQGVSNLGNLLVGDFVEADAFVDSKANIVANLIQVGDMEDPSQSKAGFVGLVTSVTYVSGNATQLNLFVREEAPDISATIPLETLVVVHIQPSTRFQVSAIGANPPQLALSAANIGIGQQIIVHGQFVAGSTGVSPLVNASSIFLTLQSIVGNFNKLVIAGSDGKTGGFVFVPCSGIFQAQSLTALTFSRTSFAGISDLTGLTKVPTLVVKGLLFLEPTLTSSGSVTLTPPSSVVVAKQVHQLQ